MTYLHGSPSPGQLHDEDVGFADSPPPAFFSQVFASDPPVSAFVLQDMAPLPELPQFKERPRRPNPRQQRRMRRISRRTSR